MMDLLLDTHVLLWWDQDDGQLAHAAREAIADPENRVFVSAATPWEIAIKARKGKLRFKGSPVALIKANGFLPLPIDPVHGEAAGLLEWSHPDPFDRVLVAQAQHEKLVLTHADPAIREFGDVTQLWARHPQVRKP
ncbi:MAG: type II toxin-antitoxin system VapC family toxin [Deltaproteobacteria bacterium]|nr:type II toxin-antitoxin system VapC family toxin [Deltaproteobacteria bacterium]